MTFWFSSLQKLCFILPCPELLQASGTGWTRCNLFLFWAGFSCVITGTMNGFGAWLLLFWLLLLINCQSIAKVKGVGSPESDLSKLVCIE